MGSVWSTILCDSLQYISHTLCKVIQLEHEKVIKHLWRPVTCSERKNAICLTNSRWAHEVSRHVQLCWRTAYKLSYNYTRRELLTHDLFSIVGTIILRCCSWYRSMGLIRVSACGFVWESTSTRTLTVENITKNPMNCETFVF